MNEAYGPRVGRVVLLFVGAFATMILPVAAGIVLAFMGPPPYVLHGDRLGSEWAGNAERTFPDGSSVAVWAYPNEAAARHGTGALVNPIPRSATQFTPGVTRYTRRDNGRHGLVLAVGNRVIHIEADTDHAVESRLAALPFVAENPEKGPLAILFTRHLGLTVLAILAFFLVWLVLLFRAGSWAGAVSPAPGVTPVPAEELCARLLAINDLELPFRVRDGDGGRLVAEWRIADARWVGLTSAGALSKTHEVHLEIDPGAHVVRAQDRDRTVSWEGGLTRLTGSWSFFRGINFLQYDRGVQAGLFFRDGRWTTTAYDYRFQLAEMKNPLIQAVVESGWTFRPVVSFFRLFGRPGARQAAPAAG